MITINQVRSVPAGTASRAWPAMVGACYALAWLVGLSVFSSSTSVGSTGAQLLRADRGHEAALALQYLLTEGLAGVCLGAVVWAAHRRGVLPVIAVRSGLAAAAVSLAQCGLGQWLALGAVSSGDARTARALYHALNQLDGIKMLLLVGIGVAVATRAALPTWLRWFGGALAVTIAISGLGYLLTAQVLATAAWASLPCLIIVVTALGIVVTRSADARSRDRGEPIAAHGPEVI